MSQIQLSFEQVKGLLDLARQMGTEERWPALALQWMEAAQTEIGRLQEELRQVRGTPPEK